LPRPHPLTLGDRIRTSNQDAGQRPPRSAVF
jgi:hypothetical protein